MGKCLVKKTVVLEKFPGKGGWTYARLPEVKPDKKNPFGFVKVKGKIDGVVIQQYHLMPMGNGELFLPVKSEIRKKIGKKQGDSVQVVLYKDEEPFEPPADWLVCLRDEPKALEFFNSLKETRQKELISRIYSVKNLNLRAERMATAITQLAMGRMD